jgi:glycosyltransferase involved in cell wall biosynthesis
MAPDARVSVIENGVDVGYYSGFKGRRRTDEARRYRVVFVGSMDYHANADAAVYFAREVWPMMRQHKPELVFTIVGRNPTPEVRALAALPGIEVTGTVDDVRPYYREALAAVVPLRIGGGSRLKILEAMAAGVPVISTRLGAEGLTIHDGQNIILAETPDDFRHALLDFFENTEQWQRLSSAASTLVRTRYDWSAIGATLLSTHRELMNRVGKVAGGALTTAEVTA